MTNTEIGILIIFYLFMAIFTANTFKDEDGLFGKIPIIILFLFGPVFFIIFSTLLLASVFEVIFRK